MDNKELLKIAKEAKSKSYCPYSKFKVGACLLTKSGKIYTGANIENSSYPATVCAERVAGYDEFCKENFLIILENGKKNKRIKIRRTSSPFF